jgi:hypothetical protein
MVQNGFQGWSIFPASFSFVIGKALSHVFFFVKLQLSRIGWIPTEPFPTSADIKSENLGIGKQQDVF